MRQDKTVDVIIPALNEEEAIGKVIRDIPDWVDRIIVVDNGSDDGTASVASDNGAIVVHEPVRGYGQACLTGLRHTNSSDIIVFLDGDYSDHAEEMGRLVDPLVSGEAHLVIGSRTLGKLQKGALTGTQRFGNWLACSLMRLFWGVRYTDLGPFRAICRNKLAELKMCDRNYGWTIEMQIKAPLHQLNIIERPVSYRSRIGVSKISGTIKGSVLAGIKILSVIGYFLVRHGVALPSQRTQQRL